MLLFFFSSYGRFFLSCLFFSGVSCGFLAIMADHIYGCRLDLDMEVSRKDRIEFFWAKSGQKKTEGVLKKKISQTRSHYSYTFPFRPQKILLRIDPVESTQDVKLKRIRIFHPMYETYEVDLKSHFLKKPNYAHLTPDFLEDGHVMLKAETKNPWFLVELDMKKKFSISAMFFATFLPLFLLLFFCLHPLVIKGRRRKGVLLIHVDLNADDQLFSLVLQNVFKNLRLIKIVPSGDGAKIWYSFSGLSKGIDEEEFAELFEKMSVQSYRIQYNRSGEV